MLARIYTRCIGHHLPLSQQGANTLLVSIEPRNKILLKTPHAICQQARAMQ
jgi:hypothetical protein